MFLEWPEQLHGILIKEGACFGTSNLCLSGSALDRGHRFNLVRLTAVDGGLAAFVVERVDDHFEFAVAIQVKDRGDLGHVRSNRLIRLLVNLTGTRNPKRKSHGLKNKDIKRGYRVWKLNILD